MTEIYVRVVTEADDSHRWMVVDHVWDGISAPMAIAPAPYSTVEAAQAAGEEELQRIKANPARDHPLQD